TEPIGNPEKGHSMEFSYRMSYRWNNADKFTYNIPDGYDLDILPPPGVEPDPEYSNSFRNNFFNQDISLGYRKSSKTFNFNAGLSLVPSMSESTDLINSSRNIPTRWVWNFAPYMRMRYKFSKHRSLQANYRGRSSQPSMTQLQPVDDISDPLNIKRGNPNLDPSFSHNLNIRFQDFNADAQRSIMLMGDFSFTQNAIISKTTFDKETSGRLTTYVNVNGVWSARLMNMMSMPLRNKKWMISNHIFGNANHNIGFNNGERNASLSFNIFESPGISFRPDHFEFELRPQYGIQLTHNSLQNNNDMTVHRYGGRFDATYYTPWGLTLQSDINYSATSGYSAGYDTKTFMWNATISQQFLRDKSLTLSLRAYDLLNQRKTINRTVTANYIEDIDYNSLSRYFMV
ncbi:MAG: outer membrane beta-barrel family protein, partial [Duncaniella sp.]|nr:outer membrane beta-barrel family protein [Duncaniella sp.]